MNNHTTVCPLPALGLLSREGGAMPVAMGGETRA